jgi:hypothetical protein
LKKILITGLAITSIFTLAACSDGQETSPKAEEVAESKQTTNEVISNAVPKDFYKEISSGKIEHIHGIGYSGNLPGVSVATHKGLKIYQDGKWLEAEDQQHDYMGFQATKNGFFASGHPEPGSNLKNPLGLVKSGNGGASFEKLAFYGETDFHNMSAGYNSGTVYVYNEKPNSKLKQGFYFSTDNGQTWKQSNIDGISSGISSFAVHPDQMSVVAMSTKSGIFLSTDYGNTFKLFSKPKGTIAITFGNEDIIYSYITEDKQQGLTRLSVATSEEIDIKIPSLDSDDLIMYIAQNKKNPAEIVFATKKSNIFLTTNSGEKWEQIVKNGSLE